MEQRIKRVVDGKGEFKPTKDFFCHFFMSTVTRNKEFIDYIRSRQNSKSYDFENGTFDVKFTVDGYEINPEPFFELLENNFERLVEEKANEKFNQMFPDAFSEDMDEMKEKINNVFENMQDSLSQIVDKYRSKIRNHC